MAKSDVTSANPKAFKVSFAALTGSQPMSWQARLYEEHFAKGDLPPVIDIPTGLGKTMVMAIWLIARAMFPGRLPTRLIYVVDRRTVVDQATDLAKKLQKNCEQALGIASPSISTLRGQLADNREWSRDPSRPAIVIGTVDLIGSALLFSGYRSSYKRRPLEAGLLGQDSLLVLDEAHLSRPFEKLLGSIGKFQNVHGKPLRVIRMSATNNDGEEKSHFKLEDSDLVPEVPDPHGQLVANPVVERFGAKKRLIVTTLGEKDDLKKKLAEAAIELAQRSDLAGTRIVVFVRRPDDAKAVAKAIREHVIESVDESGPKPKKIKTKPFDREECVEVLTGALRGLERDQLVEKAVFKNRWLNGDLKPDADENQSPVFLISTSAGEVGFDLNADHLVGDEAPLDSWIQRLGRVNRRGKGDATIILVRASHPADKNDFDKACAATTKLLSEHLAGKDVSPKALAAFRKSLVTEEGDQALSPKPTMVELTDILLDAWSLTSITERMPGRPEVGPWLRGVADELPQTTMAWRAELDEPGFAELDLDDIEEWFDSHRILTHETLSVPTSSKSEDSAEKWLMARWKQLGETLGDEERRRIGACPVVIDRAGLKVVPLADLIGELNRGNTSSIRFAALILPASFGGIERGVGLLDPEAPKKPEDTKNDDEHTRQGNAKARLIAPDVADVRDRYREKVEKPEDGEALVTPLIPDASKPAEANKYSRLTLELDVDDERTIRLVSHVPKPEKPEYGTKKQTLRQHVDKVCNAMRGMISEFKRTNPGILTDDFEKAARFAADWHDHGKNRERWQRTIGGTATVGTTDWMQQEILEGDGKHQCVGKSGGEMKRDSRGYRHEFGSLREFTDAFNSGELHDDAGIPISQEVFDLAMHLIAVHHGRGRPHFPKGGFDPDCESRSDEIHAESIRRFARLQRKYGWWRLAWLENLLRCADALASADDEVTEIDEAEGGEQ